MARTKGFDPPFNEFTYRDADNTDHYAGENIRAILGEGSLSRYDPEVDIVGQSRRGERPGEQGEGSEAQKQYRENFLNCIALWNSLPEVCPDTLPDPPPTSKDSVWAAKLEHGVVCSYFDLFLRCCLMWANDHGNAMPDGDCFPCVLVCDDDPAMAWDSGTSAETIDRVDSVAVAITGLNTPFTWSVSGTGFSIELEVTGGLINVLHANATACGSAVITVTGCDDREVTGSVRCTTGQWVLKSSDCQMPGASGSVVVSGLSFNVTYISGHQKQYSAYSPTGDFSDWFREDCPAATAQVCIGSFDCLTFAIPCGSLLPGDAPVPCAPLVCKKAECDRSWLAPYWWYRQMIREYYTLNAHAYYEWEC